MSGEPRQIVVVGASLAGLKTADALREAGFDGALTLIGAEPHLPYDRPPLSKELRVDDLPLPPDGLRADWRLGRRATRLDPVRRRLALDDGELLGYDGLVIATGATARSWSHTEVPLPRGVFTLRGRDDTEALRAAFGRAGKVVVVGAGFLGGEVAAAARRLGLGVTLVESAGQPLERAVGEGVGAFVARLHREAGIDLRTDCTVTAFHGDPQLTGVTLSDGSVVDADVAVLALGAVPATSWLEGSGVLLDDGVRCDAALRVLAADGSPIESLVAAGDVTRWPHPLAGGEPVALGHWTNAVEQAIAAAHNLLTPERARPFEGVPSFWSDLHGVKIRSVGLPALADEVRIVELDVAERCLEASYHRGGRLVGALTVNRVRRLAGYRTELRETLALSGVAG